MNDFDVSTLFRDASADAALAASEVAKATRDLSMPKELASVITKTGTPKATAMQITGSLNLMALGGHLYWYDMDAGVYVKQEPMDRLESAIVDLAPANVRSVRSLTRESLYILLASATDAWESPPLDSTNTRSGIYHFETQKLSAHSPEYLTPVQLNWRPEQEGDDSIGEWLDSTLSPMYKQRYIDLCALCLIPDTRWQVAAFFTGSGGNGKGVAASIISHLLGDACGSVSLSQLTGRFMGSALRNKLANISFDTSVKDIRNQNLFKSIVASEPMMVEEKGKPLERFKPYARLICLTNDLEGLAEQTIGVMRRIEEVKFEKHFPAGEANVNLTDTLLTDDALDGFMYRHVLPAFDRVHRSGITPVVDDQGRRVFMQTPMDTFFDENLVFTNSYADMASAGDIYKALKKFWRDEGETGKLPSQRAVAFRLREYQAVSAHTGGRRVWQKVILKGG